MSIFQAYKEQFMALIKPQIISGKAINVNTLQKTFDLKKDNGGANLVNVKMRCLGGSGTKGVWVKPKEGAKCAVLQLNKNEYNNILISCEEFEELTMESDGGGTMKITSAGIVELNGNTYNLLKDTDTKVELAKMKARLDAVIACFGTGANSGGAVVFSGLASVTSLPTENFSSIENQNVKHG